MRVFKRLTMILVLLMGLFSASVLAAADALPEEDEIRVQLETIRGDSSTDSMLLIKNLENTLDFIERAKKQQEEISQLNQQIKASPETIKKSQANIKNLQEELEGIKPTLFNLLAITELETKQNEIQQELQNIQNDLGNLNGSLVNNRFSLVHFQNIISENSQRLQQLSRQRYNNQLTKALRDEFNAESYYLELNNKYNALLSQNNDLLILLDETKRNEAHLKQKLLQRKLTLLQETLNSKRLIESQAQAQQAKDAQQVEDKIKNKALNAVIQQELDINTRLSKLLLEQTEKLNNLSQDSLRIKNVLDGLTQTQRNIEEQISALQGTLVLSRIINQQKQALPTDQLIKGLSRDIADLRVMIFENSQKRDAIYNIYDFIDLLSKENKIEFNNNEKKILDNLLQERRKILADVIKVLNNQLNLSINIESNQKQVVSISDSLQNKLQQQSFWVKSNNPMDFGWLESFPKLAIKEISELTKYIGFENLDVNFLPTLLFICSLLFIYAIIIWRKQVIKNRLRWLANNVNTLKNDGHLLTPEAMFWTIILALPSTLMFLVGFSIVVYLFFYDPLAGWEWVIQLSLYWWFFATILSLLRPNGLAYRHFGMPQASNQIFQRIIKQSIWIIVLLIVSSVFSDIEIIGFTNDVIGQVVTIVALALCLLVVRPLLDRGIIEYAKSKNEDGTKRSVGLFKLLRLVLIFVPLSLIILIVLGYYYTAVYLIEHLINSYFIALIWVFGRYFAYRSLTISSRRMAYRRLQEKRQKLREQEKEELKEQQGEDIIKISTVNKQIFRVADLVGWVVLFAMQYAIWSDLISVAYYLDGVILWEQIETTSKGIQIESITLLNLMRAILNLTITYVLVKNISGLLEVTVFSRIKLSKGTPHTIIAVLTYVIVTIGCISAFTALGISWGKIQWVFTALSVGLGFGVREIFGSFVSGTILLFERPIRVGDKVTVGQYTGIISKIRLRSTTLLNSDNLEVVLPNQAFVTDRFINWTLNNTVTRLQFMIRVNYGEDLKLVRRLLLQAANESPKVMQDPAAEVNLLHFTENALEHELLVHVAELNDRTETVNFLNYRISQLFKDNGIKFAFNQLDVHIHSGQ